MHISKFRISAEATNRLRALRQRAGLTPNLICRMAIATSLHEGPVGPVGSALEDGQEFNAYTLFGVDQPIYTSLLRLVEAPNGEVLDESELSTRLRCHIDRGVRQLSTRIKTPADAARLLAGNEAT